MSLGYVLYSYTLDRVSKGYFNKLVGSYITTSKYL